MEIVFAKTRAEYQSYTDYWNLVKAAGFDTCYVDQILYPAGEKFYIVCPLNGEYRPYRDMCRDRPHNATVVNWCLERPSGANGLAEFRRGNKRLLDEGYFDQVWVSDKFLAEQCQDDRIRFVILGSHTKVGTLERKGGQTKDVIHLSYVVWRRSQIYDRLKQRGVSVAGNAWGDEKRDALMSTKWMLNVHQDDYGLIEPLRFSLAASYGLPIISQTCYDAYPYTRGGDGHCILQVEYNDLVGTVINKLKEDYRWHRAMGWRCHRMMVDEFEFGKMVIQAAQGVPMPSTLEIV